MNELLDAIDYHELQVNDGKEDYDTDVDRSHIAPLIIVTIEVAEEHQQVQHYDAGCFIECLNPGGELSLQRIEHIDHYQQGQWDNELNQELPEEEISPEHQNQINTQHNI